MDWPRTHFSEKPAPPPKQGGGLSFPALGIKSPKKMPSWSQPRNTKTAEKFKIYRSPSALVCRGLALPRPSRGTRLFCGVASPASTQKTLLTRCSSSHGTVVTTAAKWRLQWRCRCLAELDGPGALAQNQDRPGAGDVHVVAASRCGGCINSKQAPRSGGS